MPPNGEVYGITGPLRMRVGRSYATDRGRIWDNGAPTNEGRAVICHRTGSVWDNGRPMVAPTKRREKEGSV